MAVSERRFGLEIECGLDGNIWDALDEINSKYGLDMEEDCDGTEYELRTPPLKGEQGFDTLKGIYRILLNHGGYVTRSDGAHVHFEALDYAGDNAKLARLVRSWVNLEPAIEQCVHPYRRSSGACPKIEKRTAREVANRSGYYGRGALNIYPVVAYAKAGNRPNNSTYDAFGDTYCRHCDEYLGDCYCYNAQPTIEVRLHEGSLDFDIMRPWIEMVQRLMDKVSNEGMTIRTCSRVDTLGRRLELPDETINRLTAKARIIANPNHPYNAAFGSYDSRW